MTGDGAAGRPVSHRSGPRPQAAVLLSVLGSAATVAAVGCFCALVYPIIKGERVLNKRCVCAGFWSILVLSVLVGCICCVFSWTFSYLDSYQPGFSPRDGSGRGFLMSYGVAVLNGIMAMLTVIWSLS
uniref:Uncharacterized protein n=1 Tax=Amphiprion percula TaxID=161767 RepID=A0A3P8SHP5_AMPPE